MVVEPEQTPEVAACCAETPMHIPGYAQHDILLVETQLQSSTTPNLVPQRYLPHQSTALLTISQLNETHIHTQLVCCAVLVQPPE